MADAPTLYVGTIGQSVWRSKDGGDSWHRASNGLFPEANIRALAVAPNAPSILFAGTEEGICRSSDDGDSWQRLESPMNKMQVWAIAINPCNSDTIYAGTCPSAVFKSNDGVSTWRQLDVELAEECPGVPIVPRVTSLILDPTDD